MLGDPIPKGPPHSNKNRPPLFPIFPLVGIHDIPHIALGKQKSSGHSKKCSHTNFPNCAVWPTSAKFVWALYLCHPPGMPYL